MFKLFRSLIFWLLLAVFEKIRSRKPLWPSRYKFENKYPTVVFIQLTDFFGINAETITSVKG
jgi:hypothetical protein